MSTPTLSTQQRYDGEGWNDCHPEAMLPAPTGKSRRGRRYPQPNLTPSLPLAKSPSNAPSPGVTPPPLASSIPPTTGSDQASAQASEVTDKSNLN